MKKLYALLLSMVLILSLTACSGDKKEEAKKEEAPKETENETVTFDRDINVYTLMGPTGIGMAKLMDDNEKDASSLKYNFTVASAPDQISSQVIKGDYDIAALPVNLASVLFNKTKGNLYVAGVNTLGVLYILENGDSIQSMEDLKGTTLYATGQGSTPEYVLSYLLEKNNLTPGKDVKVEYLTEHAELATKMTSSDISLGMLPEPNVTSTLLGNKDVRVALDLTKEWSKVSDADMVQGVIVINKTFADENPDVVKEFLKEYNSSVEFVKSNVDEAATMCETAGIVPKAAIAKKAIPNCNLTLVTGTEMKDMVGNMLKVLSDANPASVGGKLPSDDFYLLTE
ncbi:MAG: ABC transporter substrate-binding protein [Lachnospiraceae bacterium]|nr:ABC transporter substrate-binding protein [Lachnospiraceae bacterium]